MDKSTSYAFSIFQMGKDADRNKKYSELPEDVDTVDLKADKYELIYIASLNAASVMDALDSIFIWFNTNKPSNFRGHSLSVSDIIWIDDKYYFCQPFGFKEIKVTGLLEI